MNLFRLISILTAGVFVSFPSVRYFFLLHYFRDFDFDPGAPGIACCVERSDVSADPHPSTATSSQLLGYPHPATAPPGPDTSTLGVHQICQGLVSADRQ